MNAPTYHTCINPSHYASPMYYSMHLPYSEHYLLPTTHSLTPLNTHPTDENTLPSTHMDITHPNEYMKGCITDDTLMST